MHTELQTRLATLLSNAAQKRFLKKAVFSKCVDKATSRASATLFEKNDNIYIQIEFLQKDGKALHQNIVATNVAEIANVIKNFSQINLIGDGSDAEYRKSKNNSEVILGEKRFENTLKSYGKKIEIKAHNRTKKYIFDGSEPFLYELAISDKLGRVYDKKQAKFRQINRFIEYVADIYKFVPESGTLNILDLCCGKSYLSFAVYHYFTITLGREVNMVGIDLKKDVIEFCESTARNLGYTGLHFYACNINDYKYNTPVHLVVSLHACDIATDIVLTKAIDLSADVILSTPCCQNEVLSNLATDEFSFVTKYPILKKKFCDALTDALRLSRLEAFGYEATAIEFTDPDDTPKNILLRAVKSKKAKNESVKSDKVKENYDNLCKNLFGDKDLFIKGK